MFHNKNYLTISIIQQFYMWFLLPKGKTLLPLNSHRIFLNPLHSQCKMQVLNWIGVVLLRIVQFVLLQCWIICFSSHFCKCTSVCLLFIQVNWCVNHNPLLLFKWNCFLLSHLQCKTAHVGLLLYRKMAQGLVLPPGSTGRSPLNRRPCTWLSWHTWALALSLCLATSEISSELWA